MKNCPKCNKEIQERAIKCRYCLKFIDSIEDEKSTPDVYEPRSIDILGWSLYFFIMLLFWINYPFLGFFTIAVPVWLIAPMVEFEGFKERLKNWNNHICRFAISICLLLLTLSIMFS